MKKIAILIYPEFSIQEIGDIMYLFRWHYDIKTEIIASSNDIVVSEEGVCNEQLPFINNENRVLQPVVIDGNIITAAGSEGRKFAIAVARKLGFECSDNAVTELDDNYTDKNFIHRLPPEEFEDAKKHFAFLFNHYACLFRNVWCRVRYGLFVKKYSEFGLYDRTWAGFLFLVVVLVVVMQIFEKIKKRILRWTM